ncbi:hypothetical protein [Methanococcoides sp. NM1]|uniref:hypothetical protein n=1 Tax=Methanococcoides sp. NM1 TaxID=1201013 RepID=UPI0010830756|nr:hypothetical protein [Methanococcoides sp. NM1]
MHPDDLPDVETELEETGMEGGREFVKEYRILTGSGMYGGLKKIPLSSRGWRDHPLPEHHLILQNANKV